jgi:protein SCO1/2
MKKILTIGAITIGMIASSCHGKQLATNRISCCPPTGTTAPVTIATTLQAQSSIYQLPGKWTDEHNQSLELRDLKGKVRVIAMIFTHCTYACPRLVQDMKAIADSLPAAEKNKVGFVLVSFDAQRDDPAQLARFASQQGLDDHWTLLHGDPRQIRELSMVLNVKYQDAGDNTYTHSNAILILDKQGSVIRSLEGLEAQTSVADNEINRLVNR